MNVLVTCKYEEDPIKMKALECSQHFPHYIPMGVIGCNGYNSKKFRFFKSKENIHKKEVGPYRGFGYLSLISDRAL